MYLAFVRTSYLFIFTYLYFSANSTSTETAIENSINVEAKKLLKDEWTQANSETEVQNFLYVAIATTVVAVIEESGLTPNSDY